MSSENQETEQINAALSTLTSFNPDLIIEGGTNNRPILKNLVAADLPNTPYVGIDLNFEVDFSGFTKFGNCVRPEHVLPIIKSYDAKRVAFLTYNALNAIFSNKLNPWDRKDYEDRFGMYDSAVNTVKLYDYQLHFGLNPWWDQLKEYYQHCIELGCHVYDFGIHDLMVVTKTPLQSPPATKILSSSLTP